MKKPMKVTLLILALSGLASLSLRYFIPRPQAASTPKSAADAPGVKPLRDAKSLCSDFRLLQYLIFYLQNDPKANPPRAADVCPKDYAGFVRMVRKAKDDLHDLHAEVEFENGPEAILKPIVSRCTGSSLCAAWVGSTFEVIPSSVREEFYAALISATEDVLPLTIDRVDGRSMISFKSKMARDRTYSFSDGAWSLYLPGYIFERKSLFDLNPKPHDVDVVNILDRFKMHLTLDYDATQAPLGEATDYLEGLDVSRAYGCVATLELSDDDKGACVDTQNRMIIWIAQWPNKTEIQEFVNSLVAWMNENGGAGHEVFLDLRGNDGGSPIGAVHFLCMFGDDKTESFFDKVTLRTRDWPSAWQIAGETIQTGDLKAKDNLALQRIVPKFVVGDGINELPRLSVRNISERVLLTRSECQRMRLDVGAPWHWTVFTNGNEFSAAEDFLFYLKLSPEKFKVYGRPTVGGSGNPTWLTLPKTGTKVRLSSTRSYFNQTLMIEGSGVRPDKDLDTIETAGEFRRRLLETIRDGQQAESSENHLPQRLRQIMNHP